MNSPLISPTYTDTEEKIFLAAMEVFATQGRAGARMQEIADRAGINKALVHYYFRSKDRLYDAVFAYIFRRYFMLMREALVAEGSFADTLRGFIVRYTGILDANPALIRFVMREFLDGAETFKTNFRKAFADDIIDPPRMLIQHITAAMKRREIVRVDPAQLLLTLFGACVYHYVATPIFEIFEPDAHIDRERFGRDRREHIFSIIYHGLAPRPEAS